MNPSTSIRLRLSLNIKPDDVAYERIFHELLKMRSTCSNEAHFKELQRRYLLRILLSYCRNASPDAFNSSEKLDRAIAFTEMPVTEVAVEKVQLEPAVKPNSDVLNASNQSLIDSGFGLE